MFRFTFILSLGLSLPFSSAAMTKTGDAQGPCSKSLTPEASIDRRHLEPAIRAEGYNSPSIISKGINKKGQIVLAKEDSEYKSWYSSQASYYNQAKNPGALVPQGDPRWFIHLAGLSSRKTSASK